MTRKVLEGTKSLKVHKSKGSVRKIRCPAKCPGLVQPAPNGAGGTKYTCNTCNGTFSFSNM